MLEVFVQTFLHHIQQTQTQHARVSTDSHHNIADVGKLELQAVTREIKACMAGLEKGQSPSSANTIRCLSSL
jgi:hypothetical protein